MKKKAPFLGVLASALLAALLLLSPTSAYQPNAPYYGAGRRIRMDSLKTLTFYSDKRTAYRRTSPLPQLTCVGSPCQRYQPDVVQCQSMGNEQWKCHADLPRTMRMGRVEVSCEGYDYSDDPWVLKDSCALEYTLLPSGVGADDPWRSYTPNGRSRWGEALVEGLFWIVFLGILAFIVIGLVRAIRGDSGANTGGGRGGGGGGGGWWPGTGPYNPPPPYTPKPDPDSSSSGWRPGFWTGLGVGGLAGHAAANSRHRHYEPPQASFNLGYGGGARRRGWDDDDRGVGSSSSFGGMRETTGFGGTRNR
ncbi:Protein of unknown function DUF1183, TMEM66 [Kalmanozyma brasiliensis GHG001]|uniref:Protein of unknown function DUF1183, TMEM66 n=1 Tax=Kalmanozyma brasiliensis (strain GHG001) TaxID=1365824 RepID=UPI001CEBD9BD|nr:Protein of unknown function DUF1183, TMEM66 [Kalmanozyma brasiliensis GHG001]EST07306.2 Protein of unknown function DUF1183, TMEM66 [Kalmanozyma brasiliensis GHG001]